MRKAKASFAASSDFDDSAAAGGEPPSRDRKKKEKFVITIRDNDCETETSLEVNDNMSIDEVLNEYSKKANRKVHRFTSLEMDEKRKELNQAELIEGDFLEERLQEGQAWLGTDERPVLLYKSSVAECGIKQASILTFQNPPFTVLIKEKRDDEFSVTVQVEDQFTLSQVKDAYNQTLQSDAFLNPSDGLVLLRRVREDIPLEDDDSKKIYLQQVGPNSELVIQREELQISACRYICANRKCISPGFSLKRNDVVKCPSCGFTVLFKKRPDEEQPANTR